MESFIHYGSDYYNPSRFIPIRNCSWKPKPEDGTGLWAEREGDIFPEGGIIYGWKKWCEDSKYKPDSLKSSFRFRLAENANILVLKQPEDLALLPKTAPWKMSPALKLPEGQFPTTEQLHEFYGKNPCYLDYEKMLSDGVDAVELRNSYKFGRYLMGWDCDCILIMNPEVIIPVMEKGDHVLIQPVKNPSAIRK